MSSLPALQAKKREKNGTGPARAVRRSQNVPCVVYGGKAPESINIESGVLAKECKTSQFFTTVYEMDIDGKKEKVIGKDIQRHPVTDEIIHVDFMRIDEKAKIRVLVPVDIINETTSPVIKRGGKLNVVRRKVEVESTYNNIPERFVIDLNDHTKAVSIKVDDLTMPEGVAAYNPRKENLVVVTITAKSSADEE